MKKTLSLIELIPGFLSTVRRGDENHIVYHHGYEIDPGQYLNKDKIPWLIHFYLDFAFYLPVDDDTETILLGRFRQKRQDRVQIPVIEVETDRRSV
jgi:hypothetical protein